MRLERDHVRGARLDSELEAHACLARGVELILVNIPERIAARKPRVEPRLAPDYRGAAECRDVMSPRGRDPRGFKSGDARPDDNHAAFGRRGGRTPVGFVGFGDARVVDARDRLEV